MSNPVNTYTGVADGVSVAVVGATGQVGRVMQRLRHGHLRSHRRLVARRRAPITSSPKMSVHTTRLANGIHNGS